MYHLLSTRKVHIVPRLLLKINFGLKVMDSHKPFLGIKLFDSFRKRRQHFYFDLDTFNIIEVS